MKKSVSSPSFRVIFTYTQLETHYFNTFVKDEIYHFTAGNIRKHNNPDKNSLSTNYKVFLYDV